MLVAPRWTGLYLGFGLLLCSCLVLPDAHGQSDFKRGYVIQANGDTLHGQIRNRRFFRSPEQFRFRRSESSTIQTLGIEDSVRVVVVGNRRFERHTVSVDQRPISGASTSPPKIRPQKTVFLQQLVDGRLALYYYRDDRRHFYLETPEEGPYELIRYVSSSKEA